MYISIFMQGEKQINYQVTAFVILADDFFHTEEFMSSSLNSLNH
jgi:hypothetical protein